MTHNRRRSDRISAEKCTDEVKLKLGDIMKADLKVEAARNGFDSINPLIRKIIREYLYGKCGSRRDSLPETFRDE
ncbi:MAG: hypothetical protein KGI50_07250 [Patescibacteria group bacterium]|nr:hypothetical protein [Patescibacteria group bacterium]